MKPVPLLTAALLSGYACVFGEKVRFQRVLDLRIGREYLLESRAIPVTIGYQSWSARSLPLDSPGFEPLTRKRISAFGGYSRTYGLGGPSDEKRHSLDINLGAMRSVAGYAYVPFYRDARVEELNITDDIDTVKLASVLDGAVRRLHRRRAFDDRGFWATDTRIAVRAMYKNQQNFVPFIPDSLLFFWEKSIMREISGRLRVRTIPSAGLGELRNATSAYYAFELERQLLRHGVIDFPLSDRTMAALSEELAQGASRRLRDHDYLQRYKARIDTILAADAASRPENLRYLSSFMLRRLLLKNEAPLYRGLRAGVALDQSLDGVFMRGKTTFPYEDIADSARRVAALDTYTSLKLTLDWGATLNERLHVMVEAEKMLFASEEELVFLRDGRFDLERFAEVAFDVRLTCLALHWLRMRAGADDALCWLIVPFQSPYRLYAAADAYLEDHLAITATVAGSFGNRGDRRYSRPPLPDQPLESGAQFMLSMRYRF
jgi:hypothetical protein